MENQALKNILERHSCKGFKSDPVPQKIIEQIVEAGLKAPSGRNSQSTIIIAVTNKEMRDKISKMNADILNANIDPFYGAPAVLVVLANKDMNTYLYDGSIVMENLMLAANALNIGSCWIHRAKEEFESEEGKKILKELGIEGNYEGIGNCILGYPNKEPLIHPIKEGRIYYVK